MLNSVKSTSFGIALSLVGVPLGMYFNHIIPVIEWSPVFMLFSVILISSYKNLILKILPSYNRIFGLIIIFQFFMLLYGGLSDKLTDQYLSFHLYIIFLILALSSNYNHLDYNNIIHSTFLISSVCTISGVYYVLIGLVATNEAWLLSRDGHYALEPFTIALGAIINFIAALCAKPKKKWFKAIVFIFTLLDVYVIFKSTKRTPIFVSLVILLLFFYKKGTINNKMFLKYLKILILGVFLFIVVYLKVEALKEAIDQFVYSFYNGLLKIFGDTSQVKELRGSAIQRYETRVWTYNYIENDFNIFNYFFGVGYMTRWIDNPILQSYLDMGIFGLVFYIRLVIIYPIKLFLKDTNNLSLFALLLCVYNVLSAYSSGNPYLYIKYVPIIILAFSSNLNEKKIKVKYL